MLYDSVRGMVLLHGGETGSGPFADTWAWDGARWTRVSEQGPAAIGFGLAYDSDRGVGVLHGGLGAGGPPRPVLALTWEWDGKAWRKVGDGTGPGKRAGNAMAYDLQRSRVILHGGTSANPIADTILSDTWEWDGTAWREIANAKGPPRAQHQIVYDENREVMVLFGGVESRGSAPVDTWEFYGTEWRRVANDGPPGARQFPILAYDPLRRAIILTSGGANPGGGFPDWKYSNDVWEWNGEVWLEVPVEGTLPTPVVGATGTYDPSRGQLVQFGGTPDGPNRVVSDETWLYGLALLRLTYTPPTDGRFEIRWTGGAAPYQLQSRSALAAANWQNEGEPTAELSVTVQADAAVKFFRVLSVFNDPH